jgi:hypothetical protein
VKVVLGKAYSEVTPAFLPSSLRNTHPFALVFSTCPPVLVCGTDCIYLFLEAFLGRLFAKILYGRTVKFFRRAASGIKTSLPDLPKRLASASETQIQ